MMSLEEKRIALQQQLDSLQEQMSELRDQLLSPNTATAIVRKTTAPAAAKKPSQRNGQGPRTGQVQRAGRGALKDRIVSALESAGTAGVRVKELAQELGTKPVNIHSWFHSAMKRYAAIRKISGGHYRLEGKIDSSSSATQGAAAPKQTRTRATSTPTLGKSTRAGKKTAGPSKRGELSARILSEMDQAGARGINVRELAGKLGANYKNIYIWFATTGKKNPKIKKLGKAQYRLES